MNITKKGCVLVLGIMKLIERVTNMFVQNVLQRACLIATPCLSVKLEMGQKTYKALAKGSA